MDADAQRGDRLIHQWNGVEVHGAWRSFRTGRGIVAFRKEIDDGQRLRLQHFVQPVETESSFAIEEIRNVGGSEAGTMSKQRCGKAAVIYAAKHLDPKTFMEFGKIH